MHSVLQDTIVAQCTPSGIGALSLIRISGTEAVSIADRMVQLADGQSLHALATHTIHYACIVDRATNNIIDRVLVLLMRAPKTFTGQDTVELTCHGNPFIVQNIINLALHHGARHAQPGEFTQKAVMHGKFDLIRAEAIHELVTAQTQVALKQSLAQLDGTLSHHIMKFEHELLKALALSEASFEFLDDDQEFADQIITILTPLCNEIRTLLASTSSNQLIKQGVRIAIIGSVNTGKSSLFNTLLGNKRSIVSASPGTTRDTVEALLERDGSFITLIDTAGLRTTNDHIEHEGIQRTYEQAHSADIILLVYDGTQDITKPEQVVYQTITQQYAHKIINVISKHDLSAAPTVTLEHAVHVSSHSKQGIAELEHTLLQRIHEILHQTDASPYLLSQRQIILLQMLMHDVDGIIQMLGQQLPAYELISHHLNSALTSINTLTGKTMSEQGMDLIFREFCIGK